MPKTHRYVLKKAKPGQKGRRVYGAFPSRPGEPPHKQTGRLRASVAVEKARLPDGSPVVRVGTNVMYGRFLDLGTRKMKARPWLRRALREAGPQCNAVIAGGGK